MSNDSDLVDGLEPSQLTAATAMPLPRRKLKGIATVLLVALRVYVFVTIPIVAYAFFHALAGR